VRIRRHPVAIEFYVGVITRYRAERITRGASSKPALVLRRTKSNFGSEYAGNVLIFGRDSGVPVVYFIGWSQTVATKAHLIAKRIRLWVAALSPDMNLETIAASWWRLRRAGIFEASDGPIKPNDCKERGS
jgi:hypothetical protein